MLLKVKKTSKSIFIVLICCASLSLTTNAWAGISILTSYEVLHKELLGKIKMVVERGEKGKHGYYTLIKDRELGRDSVISKQKRLLSYIKNQQVLDKDVVNMVISVPPEVITIYVINELMNRFPKCSKEIFDVMKQEKKGNVETYVNAMKNIYVAMKFDKRCDQIVDVRKRDAFNSEVVERIGKIYLDACAYLRGYSDVGEDQRKRLSSYLEASYYAAKIRVYSFGTNWKLFDDAWGIYQEAKGRQGLCHDSYVSIIRAGRYGDGEDEDGNYDRGREDYLKNKESVCGRLKTVFEDAKKSRHFSIDTCNSFISTLGDFEMWEEVKALFRDIHTVESKKKGVFPNAETYSAYLNALLHVYGGMVEGLPLYAVDFEREGWEGDEVKEEIYYAYDIAKKSNLLSPELSVEVNEELRAVVDILGDERRKGFIELARREGFFTSYLFGFDNSEPLYKSLDKKEGAGDVWKDVRKRVFEICPEIRDMESVKIVQNRWGTRRFCFDSGDRSKIDLYRRDDLAVVIVGLIFEQANVGDSMELIIDNSAIDVIWPTIEGWLEENEKNQNITYETETPLGYSGWRFNIKVLKKSNLMYVPPTSAASLATVASTSSTSSSSGATGRELPAWPSSSLMAEPSSVPLPLSPDRDNRSVLGKHGRGEESSEVDADKMTRTKTDVERDASAVSLDKLSAQPSFFLGAEPSAGVFGHVTSQ